MSDRSDRFKLQTRFANPPSNLGRAQRMVYGLTFLGVLSTSHPKGKPVESDRAEVVWMSQNQKAPRLENASEFAQSQAWIGNVLDRFTGNDAIKGYVGFSDRLNVFDPPLDTGDSY